MYDGPCETNFARYNPGFYFSTCKQKRLKTEATASQIAKARVDPVTFLKNDGDTKTVSSNVSRLDELNNKANEVNCHLVPVCKERNITFLSLDESIDPSKHLNESKLYLKSNGIKIFAENFSGFLVKLN